ncbi:hypothetical protein D6779_02895 [Candidatus Parcubacteria bacterium]|nr:MAG: hypothetical protein D6779_02895 [Candidatus Parcubacteria bacterium]
MQRNFISILATTILLGSLLVSISFIASGAEWAEPYDSNTLGEEPINTSSHTQIRTQSLGIGGVLEVFGKSQFSGAVSIGSGAAPTEQLEVKGDVHIGGKLGIPNLHPALPTTYTKIGGTLKAEFGTIEKSLKVKKLTVKTPLVTYHHASCWGYHCELSCPDMRHLTGGGCRSDAGPKADHDALYASYPLNETTWACDQQRRHNLTVYVMCLKRYP